MVLPRFPADSRLRWVVFACEANPFDESEAFPRAPRHKGHLMGSRGAAPGLPGLRRAPTRRVSIGGLRTAFRSSAGAEITQNVVEKWWKSMEIT